MKIGTTNITNCKSGSTQIKKVFSGTNLIWSSVDPDAQAFITAASITDPTQQSAINQFYIDLKGYGIYTKMKAMYLLITGSAATSKFNMVNPVDSNAAFRLSFAGGWTFSSSGATPNGTTGYADTFLTPSTTLSLNDVHISVYSRTSASQSGMEIGSSDVGDVHFLSLSTRRSGNYNFWVNQSSVTTPVSSDGSGFFIANRTASNVKNGWRNGLKVENVATASTVLNTKTMYLGALHYANVTGFYSNREIPFASIGTSMTDGEAANFYTAVNTLMTTLGINV